MDEVYDQVEEARRDHIDLVLSVVLDYVTNRLAIEGFDLGMEECDWCMQLVEHGLRSAMCASQGLYTGTAEVAETLCEQINQAEDEEEEPEE